MGKNQTRFALLAACIATLFAAFASPTYGEETLAPLINAPSDSWDDGVEFRMTDQPIDSYSLIGGDEPLFNDELLYDPYLEPAQSLLLPERTLPSVNGFGRVGSPTISGNLVRSPLASYRGRLPFFTSPAPVNPIVGVVLGREARARNATDPGDLIRASPRLPGTTSIKRQPIITTNQIRGSKDPQIVKSGSFWIPARMDLDTAMSKIDSRLLEEMIIVRGPYSSLYGPGFDFIDFEIQASPRYNGFEHHGSTWLDYNTNGEQFYARQSLMAGDNDSGFRLSYGHQTGNDYESGNGTEIPASYKSRDIEFVYGIDLTPASRFEFYATRLDQTDVEMPGQAFDIDYLKTDAYEINYTNDEAVFANRFELDAWYNRTELEGSAGRPGKRRQFPFYDIINFEGETDVESMSTGYTAAWTIEQGDATVTAGTDLRYTTQEIDEITSGARGINFWQDRNSPVPKSHQSNPGLFVQRVIEKGPLRFTTGGRMDLLSANIDADASKLQDVGIRRDDQAPLSLAEILGSDDFDRDFSLGSAFLLADLELTSCWTATIGYGYAERAPTLTELYAAEPFMFLLQNGLNTVTGNPLLDKERLWQVDAGLSFDNGRVRGSVSGYHAWIKDYITYENTNVFGNEQVNLQFVNTDIATLMGGELFVEYDATGYLTAFGTMQYVEGRDKSRNGDFATDRRDFNSGIASVGTQQIAGQPRGSFSGVSAGDTEPLPSIAPLEARLGLRLHEPSRNPNWSMELTARIVADQDRVASSLLEGTTDGFTIWDIRSYWRVNQALTFLAGIENITDRHYREYLDFRPLNNGALAVYQPGVNFYFGSELNY